jgi:hypothetical protein
MRMGGRSAAREEVNNANGRMLNNNSFFIMVTP